MPVKPWGNSRVGFIGASDAPTIVGCRTTPSRFRLWCEKRGELEPDPPNEAMEMGLIAEPAIKAAYEARTGRTVAKTQWWAELEAGSWMKATIDGVTSCDRLVEFKLAGAWSTRKLPEDGDAAGLPEPWIIQAQHQMAVTAYPLVDFAVWTADPGFRLYTVERDDSLINSIIRLEERFWDLVQSGEPPAEFGADDLQAIKRHFNREEGEAVDLGDGELMLCAKDVILCKQELKDFERQRDASQAKLLLAMGNATLATCGPYTLKRKVVRVKERTQHVKAFTQIRFTISNGDQSDE